VTVAPSTGLPDTRGWPDLAAGDGTVDGGGCAVRGDLAPVSVQVGSNGMGVVLSRARPRFGG
jgi:hypothetical protein